MRYLKIIFILCSVLLFAVSCKEETFGSSSFELKEEIFDNLLFEYGQTRELQVVQQNIKVQYVKCSEGWTGSIKNDVLTITAPLQQDSQSTIGEVGIYSRGYDDIEWILKIVVEARADVKEGEPASWVASLEENSVVNGLWQSGAVIRGYDDIDADGYDFKPSVTIPAQGMSEVEFSGIVSEGAANVYAVYPADRTLICSADGVLTGMEMSGTQYASDAAPVLAVSKASEGKLAFKNVYSYITASFEDGMIASIVIDGKDSDCTLAGTYSYDINAMQPDVSDKVSSLTLLPPVGSDAFAAGTYTFACLPETLSGINITLITTKGKRIEKSIDDQVILSRNGVYDLGTFNDELILIQKTGWNLLYCNSELLQNFKGQSYLGADGDTFTGSANDIIDGDYKSFWTYYYRADDATNADAVSAPPFYVVIDLGEEKTLSSMKLTARQPRGQLGEYKDDLWASQIGSMKVEFAKQISKRGMADYLDNAISVWTDSETFDDKVLKNQKVNKVDFSKSYTARYIRLTISKGYKNTTETTPTYNGAALAEFDLFSAEGAEDDDKIAKTNWKIVYAKSERCEDYSSQGMNAYGGWTGAARHMIDDDYLSLWSYNSSPTSSASIPTVRYMPYYFVIDFGEEININAFRLTNKWQKDNIDDQDAFDSGPGAVTVEFSNSITGRGMDDVLENGKYISSEWTLFSESFDYTKIRKQKTMTVQLSKEVKARYCRFIITKVYKNADIDGNPPTGGYGTSLAELDFFE